MSELNLSPAVESCCQNVLRTAVASRDALLFAAAAPASEGELRHFCRIVADHLAGQAAALGQVLLSHGCRPMAANDERVDRERATLVAALEPRMPEGKAASGAEGTDEEPAKERPRPAAARRPHQAVRASPGRRRARVPRRR